MQEQLDKQKKPVFSMTTQQLSPAGRIRHDHRLIRMIHQTRLKAEAAGASVVADEFMSDAAVEGFEAAAELFQERPWIKWAKFWVDTLALQLALFIACAASELDPWAFTTVERRLYWEFSAALVLIPWGMFLGGLYPGYGLTLAEKLRRRVRITTMFFMAFTLWWFFVHHDIYSRIFTVLLFFMSIVIPYSMQRLLRHVLTRRGWWGTPVLVVGAGDTGAQAVSSLVRDSELGFHPVAVVDDDKEKWGTRLSGVEVVGGLRKAWAYRKKLQYVLVARPDMPKDVQVKLVNTLPFSNILIVPDLIGMQSLWVEARDLSGMVGLEIQKNLLLPKNRYLKLAMDYFLGVPLFLISLPVLVFFGAWIYLVCGANPFYCQVREGKGGRKFKVWKLRTMYPNAEKVLQQWLETHPDARREWDSFFKLKDDPRILKGIGHFLRKSSIDELPQLWNVLRGEMSLVGPRPFPHYHLEQFDPHFRRVRRRVLPGMTGLWQVSARSDGNLSVQEKLDSYYILNWSIWLDLTLLGQTVQTVLSRKGAY